MTYDHGKKAGNKGDVWKHAVLTSIGAHLPERPSLKYLDTHSGAPRHQLGPTGEWRRGIGAILRDLEDTAHPYVELARAAVSQSTYLAGWQFFALAAAQRADAVLVDLCDTSPSVVAAYDPLDRQHCPTNVTVAFTAIDGYSKVDATPADLVFLDPPYHPNADADWKAVASACKKLRERGVAFVAWYPFYWSSRPQRLVDTVGVTAWEVHWSRCGAKPSQNLKGCGVLLADPVASLLQGARSGLVGIARALTETGDVTIRLPTAG